MLASCPACPMHLKLFSVPAGEMAGDNRLNCTNRDVSKMVDKHLNE